MEHDTVRIPSADEMDAFIKDQEILDAHVRSLSDEEKDKVFDMGYHNDTVKGYMILAMKDAGFADEEIRKAVAGTDKVMKLYSAQEARHTFAQN